MNSGPTSRADGSSGNRTTAECLIALLTGDREAVLAVAREAVERRQWRSIAATAGEWHVATQLLARLESLGVTAEPEAREDLLAHHRISFAKTSFVGSRVAALCRLLEDSGIRAAIFKGLSAVAHLYSRTQARSIRDGDILIGEQDVEKTVGILERQGLVAEYDGDLTTYRSVVRHLPGFRGNESVTLGSPGHGDVDVHWRLGRKIVPELEAERIIDRAGFVELYSHRVRVVCPADGLVLSAHHAVRENFNPGGMLRDLLDTREWFALLDRTGQLESALDHVERCRMSAPVQALALILGDGRAAQRLSPRGGDSGTDLARLFHIQAREGPLGQDLVSLADPGAWGSIARGMLSGWKDYRTIMNGFETRKTGAPVHLTGRVADVVRRLGSLRAGSWKSLRTAAKVRARYQEVNR